MPDPAIGPIGHDLLGSIVLLMPEGKRHPMDSDRDEDQRDRGDAEGNGEDLQEPARGRPVPDQGGDPPSHRSDQNQGADKERSGGQAPHPVEASISSEEEKWKRSDENKI